MTKRWMIVLAVGLVAAALPFVGSSRNGAESASTVRSVVDLRGRSVSVPSSVARVVAIGPGALRLLVYMELTERVVAVEALEKANPAGRPYWLAHPELARLPLCGPGGPAAIGAEPDGERILSLLPDLVVVTHFDGRLADRVEARLGIPVVVLDTGGLTSFDDRLFTSLHLLGRIFDRAARAARIEAFVRGEKSELLRRMGGGGEGIRPYVGGIGCRGSRGLGSTELRYPPFDWLGLRHAAAGLPRPGESTHRDLDWELLLSLDPTEIFLDGGGRDVVRDELAKHAHLIRDLRAFRTGRVWTLWPYNWYSTNVGTALVDAWAVGRRVRPAAFADVDLGQRADAIYAFLVGKSVTAAMEERYGGAGAPWTGSRTEP